MIKRERWNNKFIVVARDKKGHILAWKKWSKDFQLKDAASQYKQTRSFDPLLTHTELVHVRETVDYRKGARKAKTGLVQYVIELRSVSYTHLTLPTILLV